MIIITVYGGANSIGGNKILLEDQDTRLFFDFGMSFKVREQYFEEYLKPRPGAGLLDMLKMEHTNEQGLYFDRVGSGGTIGLRRHVRQATDRSRPDESA